MERYKRKYIEWDPKTFQKAKDSGLLDGNIKSKGKIVPKWILELLDDFEWSLKDINSTNIHKNKIHSYDDRVIIWNNNFYSTSKFIHAGIFIYLILNEGLILPGQSESNSDRKNSNLLIFWMDNIEPYLGLHLVHEKIYIGESYEHTQIEKINKLIQSNKRNYLTVIKKIEKETGFQFKGTQLR